MKEREGILALANAIRDADGIEIHSGDREPGSPVSRKERQWIVAGLKLLANGKEARLKKKLRS